MHPALVLAQQEIDSSEASLPVPGVGPKTSRNMLKYDVISWERCKFCQNALSPSTNVL